MHLLRGSNSYLATVRPAKKVQKSVTFGTISGLELLENEWVDRQGFLGRIVRFSMTELFIEGIL